MVFAVGMNVTDLLIRTRLVGADEDAGAVQFDDFHVFCDKMYECLRITEQVVTKRAGRVHYRIVQLNSGSAAMVLEAVAPKKGEDQRAEVVGLFKKTIADLQAGKPVDPRLTSRDLKKFRELRAALKRTKEVWLDGAILDSQYVANIDRILGSTVKSEGSVTGLLERLNVHNKNEFILYPPVGSHQIVCRFPDTMFEQVRLAIRRNVTVTGTLYHHPDKAYPDVVHVKDLEIHPPNNELPKLGDLKGLLKGCTQGLTSVDFVRTLRDEQD